MGTRIPYGSVGIILAHTVLIKVDFSKADTTGCGRIITHERQENSPQFCLVTCLERWIAHTRDVYHAVENDLLYDVPGFPPIRSRVVVSVMKACVQSLGIPNYTGRLCTHSLRYGGAMMMKAAGHPKYLIANYGGWSLGSHALRLYIGHSDDESIHRVSADFARLAATSTSLNFIRSMHAEFATRGSV